jgi:hypothetical protein
MAKAAKKRASKTLDQHVGEQHGASRGRAIVDRITDPLERLGLRLDVAPCTQVLSASDHGEFLAARGKQEQARKRSRQRLTEERERKVLA